MKIVSTKLQQITGYTASELSGMYSLDIVLSDDREMVKGKAIKILKKERTSPYEFRLFTKDGEITWIMETVTSIQYQRRRATLANFMDITRRKEAEKVETSLYRIPEASMMNYTLQDLGLRTPA